MRDYTRENTLSGKPDFIANDLENRDERMSGCIVPVTWVGSIISNPPGN